MRRICSQCQQEIEGDEYYKCLDNFLQVKYFDTDAINCFCSPECFCQFVMLETIEISEEEKSAREEDDDSC